MTNKKSKKSGKKKKKNYKKHHLKRKVTDVTVNKTQVLVVLITANRIKPKVLNHQHQKLIIKKIIDKSRL